VENYFYFHDTVYSAWYFTYLAVSYGHAAHFVVYIYTLESLYCLVASCDQHCASRRSPLHRLHAPVSMDILQLKNFNQQHVLRQYFNNSQHCIYYVYCV